jgi:aryl-alcohol dehydrogenase-like predicted oxidoreductase
MNMTSLRNLGTTDTEVYPLNLGGNVFGWTADKDESFAVLDAYTAAGGNFVDTADTYSRWVPGNSGGESEAIIGEWLAARKNRADMVIATKGGRHPEATGLRPDTIRKAVDASLRRLRTDYIDLYYTHFDDESVPVEEIITTLHELVRAGKLRAIAASNITSQRLRSAQRFAGSEGLTAYVALQPHYNLVSRDTYEGELRDVATEFNLAVFPYYGIAGGFLTGKYRPGATSLDSGRTGGSLDPSNYLKTERGPTVTAPIASARTTGQLPALLAVTELRLTADDLAKLDAASA